MIDPLNLIRSLIHSPGDAVRWACLLEATAPKPGNVFPGRSFPDLKYLDFVKAAEISVRAFSRTGDPISQRMLSAVDSAAAQLGTNVNLGIVLLLGPLVAADETMMHASVGNRTDQNWKAAIAEVVSGFDGADGHDIFRAIKNASAGGLGDVDSMDVREIHAEVDIVEAMTLAADRDLIARQYATGFMDLIERIVPLVGESIRRRGDLLGGIVDAHLRMLTSEPDSLIARKNGFEVAAAVRKRAQNVDLDDPASLSEFDASLRKGTHELNPGTTADLIAAALYMLLRTPTSD